ncbi:MAG TPA: branched-chain amino acid ABC transporter permease [Nitrososphaerales archaeon]|nr:branched-chain amino acid ABC transporter permease [Nitrososphaerales archaeon]
MPVGLTDIVQNLVNGLLQGGFLALASVGLSLIYGVQKILNIAHGAFIVIAAFVTIDFSILLTPVLHLDPLISIVLDFGVLIVFGVLTYFGLIYKTENKGFEGPLLATFGLSIFIEYVITNGLIFPITISPTQSYRLVLIPVIDPSYGNGAIAQNQAYSSNVLNLGGITFPEPQLIAFLLAFLTIPLLHLFLTRTYYGNGIRATAQDWEAAEFSGIDIRKTRILSFALGSGLAGIAGGIYAFTNSVFATEADVSLLPLILAIIILGGVGSVIGTLIAGLVVGLLISGSNFLALEVLTQYSFPSDIGVLLTFLIFLIVLMVRPSGFFGKVVK